MILAGLHVSVVNEVGRDVDGGFIWFLSSVVRVYERAQLGWVANQDPRARIECDEWVDPQLVESSSLVEYRLIVPVFDETLVRSFIHGKTGTRELSVNELSPASVDVNGRRCKKSIRLAKVIAPRNSSGITLVKLALLCISMIESINLTVDRIQSEDLKSTIGKANLLCEPPRLDTKCVDGCVIPNGYNQARVSQIS